MKNFLELEMIVYSELDLQSMSLKQEELNNLGALNEEELFYAYRKVDNNSRKLPLILFKSDVENIVSIVPEYNITVKKEDIPLCSIRIEKQTPSAVITNMYSNIVGNPIDIAKKIQTFLKENKE